tara:strand:- start:168 stop:608 length:441 start_codon:yes stop_codon:yes gene_type:complete
MKKAYTLLLFAFLLVFLIIVYGQFRCYFPKFNDPLSLHTNVYVDGWLLSHFIAFALAGYFFPKYFYLAICLGILWEVVEFSLGRHTPTFLKCNVQNKTKPKFNALFKKADQTLAEQNDAWWYGRYEDIVVDFFGFVTGYFVRYYSF